MAGHEDDATLPASAPGPIALRDLAPGTRVRDYLIVGRLASGGFGSVYLADHTVLGRRVAIKVLHAELVTSRELVARFEREARAVNVIRHPNVVDIHDFGELDDGRPFFVMEYLEGLSLGDYVRRRGALPLAEIGDVLGPLCDALATAHEHGIIHRDLAPANVFLEGADERGWRRLVLLDFGVAKLLSDDAEQLTRTRQRIGTPMWMAPEQLMGLGVDPRVDVYAVGALMYFMLTGQPPFGERSPRMLIELHVHGRRPRPSERVSVPRAIDDLVVGALAVDADERPATVRDLYAGFERAITREMPGETRPVLAGTPGIALHVEVIADAEAIADADDTLLDDMDAVLELAASVVESRGFAVANQTGTATTYARAVAGGADPAAARRDAIELARALRRTIDARDHRDARLHVNVCVHAGSVVIAGDKVRGGDVTRLADWVPAARIDGVVATEDAVDGVDVAMTPLGDRRFRIDE